MNGFRKLEERLTAEGWYVGWAELCCQSCAWGTLPMEHETGPFKGQDIDFSKVLFNHEQDCEDEQFAPEGLSEDEEDEYWDEYIYEGEGTMATLTPEIQDSSTFCFDGTKEGVKNLKAIIPIIEECGCAIYWNGSEGSRPDISWNLEE